MKKVIKSWVRHYFNSGWLPVFFFLVCLAGSTMASIPYWPFFQWVAKALFGVAALAYLGIIAACIWNLIRKRWGKGFINFLLIFGCGVATGLAFTFLMVMSMFGPSDDGFADHLEIPAHLSVTEPGEELDARSGSERDAFQAALLAALQTPGSEDSTITGSIPALLRLQEGHDKILRRYLASSPAWRVFEKQGNRFATRRWRIGSEWQYTLHGYYTRHKVDRWSDSGTPDFQSRLTIGLSGKSWWRGDKDTTWLSAGETAKAILSTGNQMHQSHCIISADSLVVELFEQSETPERRLSKAALAFLQAELEPLAEHPTWDTIRQILPADSIRNGDPSFALRNSFQPGLYESILWLNPGEAGMIYLKGFEVTKGTPLSVDRLKERSSEWIGWSSDTNEQFFSNTHFTIYEGDWGKPYAARLEVWFDPDAGGPDRKLIEQVFKIEGWQR